MKYPKSPLTFEEQAETINQRGLIADKQEFIAKLRHVNCYRQITW